MNRIRETLQACRDRGEKAMGLFLTSGFPERAATLPILQEIDRAGADFVEIGMPFSDPLAEGLPVQHSSEVALRNGARMEHAFETAHGLRRGSEIPILLMGYINPILRYGIQAFCHDAREAGVDGLILPDLPPEEAGAVAAQAKAAGLGMVYLIAPNTPDDRVRAIDRESTAFVYAVSVTGLTGSNLGKMESVEGYLERARSLVQENPLLVGFGIRSHQDAVRVSRFTDGFIVGSALVDKVDRLWSDQTLSDDERLKKIGSFVRELKTGSNGAATSGQGRVATHGIPPAL